MDKVQKPTNFQCYTPSSESTYKYYQSCNGRAIVQAVSHRLPTAAARVRSQVRPRGFRGGRSGTGAGVLRGLWFPLPILIPPNAPYSSIIQGWYNRPTSGRRTKWTQSHPTARNNNKKNSDPARQLTTTTHSQTTLHLQHTRSLHQ
jgi:hypothetical protein